MMKLLLFFLLFLTLQVPHFSQSSSGKWTDHLPYNNARKALEIGNEIYVATEDGGIFTFDKTTLTTKKLSKANALNDISVVSFDYSPEYNSIIIAYENTNIDIITGEQTYNLPDIRNKQIFGNKKINNIYILGENAYIASGFGIVVLNIPRKEFKEQYTVGENGTVIDILDVTSDAQYLYAATEQGIYRALITSPNLVDFNNWEHISSIPNNNLKFSFIESFNGLIFSVFSNSPANDELYYYQDGIWNSFTSWADGECKALTADKGRLIIVGSSGVSIYNSALSIETTIPGDNYTYCIYDNAGELWLTDRYVGLQQYSTKTFFYPNGPPTKIANNIDCKHNMVWVTAYDGNNPYANLGAYYYYNNAWTNVNDISYQQISGIYNTFIVLMDDLVPFRTWVGTIGWGIIEFAGYEEATNRYSQVNVFDETNSPMQTILNLGHGFVRCVGLRNDSENNLWFTLYADYEPLYVYTNQGNFKRFDFKYDKFDYNQRTGDLAISQSNDKWILLNRPQVGVFAFNEQGTIDDESDDIEKFFEVYNQDDKILNLVNAIASDLDGNMWIGTNEGPVVYYNPENVYYEDNIKGYQPKIARDDGTGLADYLLGTENITAIAVDGENRKWFATERAGVFLISADGTKQILNFTEDNSPLLSNNVYDIAINQKDGEVYFATNRGIISYISDATEAEEEFNNFIIFPNPVREDYHGPVTIRGLVKNSLVKITDISGNLVWEKKALGGQVFWDGRNFDGVRVYTGVYLIFISNEDGSKTHIAKLLFIN